MDSCPIASYSMVGYPKGGSQFTTEVGILWQVSGNHCKRYPLALCVAVGCLAWHVEHF